jgi:prophage regulatory protein
MTEPDRILRLNAVLDLTGLSRSTLYRKVAEGTFPSQVQLSNRCVGWRTSAIAEWQRDPMFFRIDEAGSSRTNMAK